MKKLTEVLGKVKGITLSGGAYETEFFTYLNGLKVQYSHFSKVFTLTTERMFTSVSFKNVKFVKVLVKILSVKDVSFFAQFRFMNDVLLNLDNNGENKHDNG